MTVNDTDNFLVNRSLTSYQIEAQNLMAELQDDDLMLVNRGGVSYKATGEEIKESLGPSGYPPNLSSVTLVGTGTDATKRFEDQSFAATLDIVEGDPVSTKSIAYKVAGTLSVTPTTSEIVGTNEASVTTLTLADNKDLAKFTVGELVQQDSGAVLVSGEWTPAESSALSPWRSLAYGGGKFVAISASVDNSVMHSSDGINWTTATPSDPYPWQSVTYGEGRFVAVSANSGPTPIRQVMWSADGGVTWTGALATDLVTWQTVTYGEGKFVAVSTNSNKVMWSDNGGVTWQSATAPVVAYWNASAYGNGLFMVTASSGESMYSDDGALTWKSGTTTNGTWQSLAYGDGRFVAVGGSVQGGIEQQVKWSDSGQSWKLELPTKKAAWKSVTYGDGKFVATGTNVAGDFERVMTSIDGGVNWSKALATEENSWNSVAYGDGKFVAVAPVDSPGRNLVMWSYTGTGEDALRLPAGLFQSYDDTTDPAAPTMTLTPQVDGWSANTGNYAVGEEKILDNATLYLETNESREVTGTSSSPVYHDWSTIDKTDEITFNQPTGTAKTWDEELPDGTTIQACAHADNTAGGGGRSPLSGDICSTKLQPEAGADYEKALGGLTTLYPGNNSTQTITNGIDLAGKGGLVWLKVRSETQGHALIDTVRGATKVLSSSSTAAEFTSTTSLSQFNSDGFHLGGNTYNAFPQTYASWTFQKAPGFFDIVTYTGGPANKEVPHFLGVKPGFMIIKGTDTSEDWICYHKELTAQNFIRLNKPTDASNSGNNAWNSTEPTDSAFTVGSDAYHTNTTDKEYVAYLFADTPELIKCGLGSGTGQVECGFEPQWLLQKNTGAGTWFIFDNKRDDYYLNADETAAETASSAITFNATGYDQQMVNTEFIYVAIAAPVVRNLTQEEVDATKLLFQTKSYRESQYEVNQVSELRTKLESQGYSTTEIDEVLGN